MVVVRVGGRAGSVFRLGERGKDIPAGSRRRKLGPWGKEEREMKNGRGPRSPSIGFSITSIIVRTKDPSIPRWS